MTFDNDISLISAVIAFFGLLLVALQIRGNTKQEQLQSMVKIYDINRKLVTLGFSHPELFDVLEDKPADAAKARRFLQLWLNLFLLAHSYLKESVFQGELKDTLVRDLSAMMGLKNMRRHWSQNRTFYPQSFQRFVEEIIQKQDRKEPPQRTATAPQI